MRLRRLLDRLRNRTAAFTHDLLMIPVAWVTSYLLRFNLGPVPAVYLDQAIAVLPVMVIIQGAVFWYFGLYRGVWRFASIPDLIRILKAIVVGVALSAICIFFLTRMQDIPRSVFPMHVILLIGLLGGPRLIYRWLKEHQLYYPSHKKALVVGAGRAGEMLVRDLLRDRSYGFFPIGFVDDARDKKGHDIRGVRVLGYCKNVPGLVARLDVDLILLAIPSATAGEMRRVIGYCEKAGIPMRTLPRMQDLVSGHSSVQDLREISIEDLLGREPVSLDWTSISHGVAGKVILVTGGGGSIGSELCRQVARLGPQRLIVFDASEFNLYRIEMELGQTHPDLSVATILGDVCDCAGVDRVFAEWRPEITFHAAAYKHVPMLESQMREAVRNNAIGTRHVACAAGENGCGTFVLISTDKAVNPASTMGASKRLAELVCQWAGRGSYSTRYLTVRFGNVLDSAGSVVPLFRRQISAGGPVTVTHPEVKRYFMTVQEACQLILAAATLGRGGEVFVLDMGESVRIRYLAEQMIRLAGKSPDEDVAISYTGLRPGEKLNEELFLSEESLSQTIHKKILLARSRDIDARNFEAGMRDIESACERFDVAGIRTSLHKLVPEFGSGDGGREPKVVPLHKANP